MQQGRKAAVLLLGAVLSVCVHAQDYIPSTLLFAPLRAAIFEPRVGVQYQPSLQRLRLDIGYSGDVVRGRIERTDVAAGIDGCTYTRLRSEAQFKFPVEAVDYMFGVNASARMHLDTASALSVRVRAEHISAHLADGYADSVGMLRQRPFVYSREFVDFLAAYEWRGIRLYGGAAALVSVKPLPVEVGRFIPQLGIEWTGEVLTRVFAAYDLRAVTVGSVTLPIHAVQCGVVVPTGAHAPMLAVCGYYYAGYSLHGMFYTQRESYWAFGLQVLF